MTPLHKKNRKHDSHEGESGYAFELRASPGPTALREISSSVTPIILRSYQQRAVEQLDVAIAAAKRAPLLVLPTGAGKTVIAAHIIRSGVERGERVLFLAPRRELIWQTSRKLVGQRHGVVLAGAESRGDTYAPVQVASIDTLLSRLKRDRLHVIDFDLIIVDEAHLGISALRKALLDLWPKAIRIGLTATPCRRDGRALGILYDTLIEPITVAELTTLRFMSPARYFSISTPDLSRVHTVAGDFHAGELDRAVNQPKLVGDIVGHWLRHAPNRQTVVFATSIAHSVALADAFLNAGVAAEHVDANSPTQMREATFDRLRCGRTQVLCNCLLASCGFDLPELACIVLARPTKSLGLYLQMIGRGLRPAEGKSDCLVLDHSGAIHMHGFAADRRSWTLEGKMALVQRERTPQEHGKSEMLTCPECVCVFNGTRLCPNCGFLLGPRGKKVQTLDGELVEIGAIVRAEELDAAVFHAELLGIARERGFQPGWAAHQYHQKFNCWPPPAWRHHPPVLPSNGTRRWVKGRHIAWVRRREAIAGERP